MSNNILALDIGDKNTGVAIIKQNIPISLEPVLTKDLEKYIQSKVKDDFIEQIILGLPVNDDGTENKQCQKIRVWAEKIDSFFTGDVILENEYLSSIEAQNNLRTQGYSPKEVRAREHSEVAKILLEQYTKNENK